MVSDFRRLLVILMAFGAAASPKQRKLDRRGRQVSLAEREHECGVGPVPHYTDVVEEHRATCGSPSSACKPDDPMDLQDGYLNELNAGFLSRRISRHQAKIEVLEVAEKLKRSDAVKQTYANAILAPLYPVFALASSNSATVLPEQELLAWRALESSPAGLMCPSSKDLCKCPAVICENNRITTVILGVPPRRRLKPRSLTPLRHFSKLRTLALSQSAFGPKSWASLAKHPLPSLRSVSLYIISKLDSAHLGKLVQIAPHLHFLQVGVRYAVGHPRSEDALSPAMLEPICELKDLKHLEILGPFTGLPDCFGQLQSLLSLDVRGCWLSQPLPRSMANLHQLRSFIAFGQREHHCPEPECIASWDNRVSIEDKPVFWCPSGGWAVPLSTVAMPEWTNLERFWVDQNFLSGPIPDWLPVQWPRLRSLDLYSNRLNGSIPVGLLSMPSMFQIQLHDNFLSGEAPAKNLFSDSLRFIDVSMNPSLSGCWPPAQASTEREVVSLAAMSNITRDRVCQPPRFVRSQHQKRSGASAFFIGHTGQPRAALRKLMFSSHV